MLKEGSRTDRKTVASRGPRLKGTNVDTVSEVYSYANNNEEILYFHMFVHISTALIAHQASLMIHTSHDYKSQGMMTPIEL